MSVSITATQNKKQVFRAARRLTTPVTERDHIRGRLDARVTLLEYGDYECSACADAYPVTEALLDALGDELRFVYRHFPLTNIHPHAERAAAAAEAAAVQGFFWEMNDLLFRNQDALEDDDLVRYAMALHLDSGRFLDDLARNAYADRIRADLSSGARSGVNGTPTFFIDEVRYDGPHDLPSMGFALRDAADAPRP